MYRLLSTQSIQLSKKSIIGSTQFVAVISTINYKTEKITGLLKNSHFIYIHSF